MLLTNGLIRLGENPEVASVNKLPARATFEQFPTRALAGRRSARNPWRIDLDGTWDFHQAADVAAGESVAAGRGGRQAWDKIEIPGHPELQGHGRPHYTNVVMPFPHEPPRVPHENPTGIFRKVVTIPAAWEGLRVVLHFGSAESLLAVWVNGSAVGLSKGSRLPAEFDVTGLAAAGTQVEIRALVAKWSDASFIEDQDMWWLSGLPRSVALLAMPSTHIGDVAFRPLVAEDCRSADFEVDVVVGCGFPVPDSADVSLQLLDAAGRPVLARPLVERVTWNRQYLEEKRGLACFRGTVPPDRLRLWSAEDPCLYTLEVGLKCGRSRSFTRIKTGFRRVEIRGGSLLFNGRRILLFGVNRHSADDSGGRAVPRERMLEDIRLMKRHHFNAVRCSHYPPDPYWLELCDAHGLYVIDEADAEAHAFHNTLCHDPRYAHAWLDRVMRMVLRDKNHPSVMLWSLGNESGYGPNIDAAAAWARHYDPTRPLHYEGAISSLQSRLSLAHGQIATDVICPMYTSIEDLRKMDRLLASGTVTEARPLPDAKLLERVCQAVPPTKGQRPMPPLRTLVHPLNRPIILCEYSHAMGNSNGSLHDYFELFRTAERVQGGFIWEWVDHALKQKAPDGRTYWAYGGDFGDAPHDANYVCDGIIGPDRAPHPAALEHRYLAQPVGIDLADGCADRATVRNRQEFTGLDWLRAEWTLLQDGKPVGTGPLALPSTAPGESRGIRLPVRNLPRSGELLLNIRFLAKNDRGFFSRGEEVAFEQLVLRKGAALPRANVSKGLACRMKVEADGPRTVVCCGPLSVAFDTAASRLESIVLGGIPVVIDGPRLALWRAAVDNDGLNPWTGQPDLPSVRWVGLGLDRLSERAAGCSVRAGSDGVVRAVLRREATGRGNWKDAAFVSKIEIHPSGMLSVVHEVRLGGKDMTDLPRVGCSWVVAPPFRHLRYYGRGPHENYPDRKSSAILGIYEGGVADEYVPYVMPQEHGHHCDARWIELRKAGAGAGLRVSALRPLGFNASHFTADDLYAARHTSDLRPRPEIHLTLDAGHRGLGTYSCGPDTLPAYRLTARKYEWGYQMTFV